MTKEFILKHLVDSDALYDDVESITITTTNGLGCKSTTLYENNGKARYFIEATDSNERLNYIKSICQQPQ